MFHDNISSLTWLTLVIISFSFKMRNVFSEIIIIINVDCQAYSGQHPPGHAAAGAQDECGHQVGGASV